MERSGKEGNELRKGKHVPELITHNVRAWLSNGQDAIQRTANTMPTAYMHAGRGDERRRKEKKREKRRKKERKKDGTEVPDVCRAMPATFSGPTPCCAHHRAPRGARGLSAHN